MYLRHCLQQVCQPNSLFCIVCIVFSEHRRIQSCVVGVLPINSWKSNTNYFIPSIQYVQSMTDPYTLLLANSCQDSHTFLFLKLCRCDCKFVKTNFQCDSQCPMNSYYYFSFIYPISSLLSFTYLSLLSALVNMSATCSSVLMYRTVSSEFLILSFITLSLLLICFILDCF